MRIKPHLNSQNNSILREKQSHVAGEIERRRQPNPSLHIELPAAPFAEQRYRGDGPLKRLRVRRDAVADPTKVDEIESHRPQTRARPRRPKDAPTTTEDD